MHTSIAAVRSSPTHWNVNGSIANTSRLVVSIATYSPAARRPATRTSRSARSARCGGSSPAAGTAPSMRSTSSTIRLNVCREDGSSSGSPLSRASRLATRARNCILRTSEASASSCASARIASRSRIVDPGPGRRSRGAPVDQRRQRRAAQQLAALLMQLRDRAAKLARLRRQPIAERRLGRVKPGPRLARRRAQRIPGAIPEPRLVQMPKQPRRLTQLRVAQRAGVQQHRTEPPLLVARRGRFLRDACQHEPDRLAAPP